MANARPLDEKDLLLRLRDGNHVAFSLLYERYKIRLTGNLLRILKSPELVEEVVQDLFMGLWEHRDRIDPDKPIKAYLYQIAANKAKNIFRKAANEQKMRALLLPTLATAHNPIEDKIFQQENRETLLRLLEGLPPQQYLVYTLCKLEGKTYKEVGRMLNITEGTINSHIRKANLYLKSKMEQKPDLALLVLIGLSIQGL